MSILSRYETVCGAASTSCLSWLRSNTCEFLNVFLFNAFINGATNFLDEAHLIEFFD